MLTFAMCVAREVGISFHSWFGSEAASGKQKQAMLIFMESFAFRKLKPNVFSPTALRSGLLCVVLDYRWSSLGNVVRGAGSKGEVQAFRGNPLQVVRFVCSLRMASASSIP